MDKVYLYAPRTPYLFECGVSRRLFLHRSCYNLPLDKRNSVPHFLFVINCCAGSLCSYKKQNHEKAIAWRYACDRLHRMSFAGVSLQIYGNSDRGYARRICEKTRIERIRETLFYTGRIRSSFRYVQLLFLRKIFR